MVLLSYSLPLGLDTLVQFMSSHPNLIMNSSFPAAAAAREQQDVRKIVLEQRSIRLLSSLKNQLNQLKFFSLFVEESFL
jgi:hypothetical protein